MADTLESLTAWAATAPPAGPPGDRPLALDVLKDGRHVEALPLFASKRVCVLGRHSQLADVVLDHASLSRQHCVLAHGPDGRVYLADLKSTHGTFLNGKRLPPLTRVPLGDGDSFTVGGSSRTYRVVAAGGGGERAGRPGAPPAAAGSSGAGAGDAPVPPVDEAEARALARKQREAEIAAMVASLAAPAPQAPAGGRNAINDGGDDDDDGGLPLPMRRRVDDDDEEAAPFGAARPAGAASATSSTARKGGIAFAVPSGARGRVGGHADEVVGAPPAATSASAGAAEGGGAGAGEEAPFPADDDGDDDRDAMAAMALPTGFGSRKAAAAARGARASAAGAGGDGPATAAAAAAADNPAFRRRRLSDADRQGDSDDDDREGGGDAGDENDDGDGGRAPQETVSDVAKRLGLPVSHEVVLGGGGGSGDSSSSSSSAKAVTALALDPSGSRLAVGTADYLLRLYDFGSMDRAHRPVRELTPVEGHPVHAVAFAPNGERFLVASGHAKARVFDARDGGALATTVKGDPYITDMANTKGHTAGLTAAAWHPTDRDVVMTGSLDGSVRFWNLAHGKTVYNELCCGDVVKLRSAHRQRVGVSAAALAGDGRFVAAAGDDGSLQLFNVRAAGHRYVRADAVVGAAHAPGGTTCVAISSDGTRLATRSGADATVKIWDVRKLGGSSGSGGSSSSSAAGGTPLGVITGVDTAAPTANVAWSPDGRLVVLGTAVRRKAAAAAAAGGDGGGGDAGRLLAFSVADVEAAAASGGVDASAGQHAYAATLVRGASVVAVAWHARINQLAAGCGDGATRVLYDPGMSTKGALLSTARAPKARDVLGSDDATVSVNPLGLDIVAPNAPALFRDARLPQKRRFLDIEKDQLADPRRRPGLPSGEPEFLNRGKKTFTQHYMQTFGTSDEWRTQDPAEALRAYAAKAAASGGAFAARAYAATQPQPVLEAKTHEQVEEEEKEEVQRLLGAGGK